MQKNAIFQATSGAVLLALFLALALAVAGCAAKEKMIREANALKVKTEEIRAKQKAVAEMGGPICGLKELAIAESNRDFILMEIEKGDNARMREHLQKAKVNINLAMAKAEACEPPDRDRDGILDSKDQCPDDPEDKDDFEDEDGCPDPDNDQDGLPDVEDKCPDDPEDKDDFQDEDGCPDPDNDEDSILDEDDKCPLDPEDLDDFEDKNGCPDPDNDQDGIFDVNDKCPNKPETFNGIDDEDGCPDESKYNLINVTDSYIELKQKIFFATGKARILSKSFPLLNEVGMALRDNPKFRIEISGHTDSVGGEAYNQKLSEARAKSVREYLVKKGGIQESRLEAVGYGESKPIDTNRTKAGKARNRRVEFKITGK